MKKLTGGQIAVLALATLLMTTVGGFGAWGTYSNVQAQLHRGATAAGTVAAGEGLALVLALTMLGLTMLGQSSPPVVRIGLWLAPVGASATGLSIATSMAEAFVYAITPLAMSGAADGLGLIARRIVVYRTGEDAEEKRRQDRRAARDAARLRDLNWHSARAKHHDSDHARKRSRNAVWRLARRIATHDAELGAALAEVQRARIVEGADATLAALFGNTPRNTVALPPATPSHPATPEAQQPSHELRNTLDEHTDDALDLVADATPCDTSETDTVRPEPTRTVAAAQQPATAVHQRITPDLEAAIEDALRTVADDDTVRLLTVAEVAKQKGVTAGTVRSWVSRGKLTPAQRDADGRLRFHPNDVAELD